MLLTLDFHFNTQSVVTRPGSLVSHSQYWQSDRGSLLGAGPLLTTFVCVHHKLSAYQLCSLSAQEISGKVEFKYWPRASSCGQWPVSLTSSAADRISAFCEAIILIWDKVARKMWLFPRCWIFSLFSFFTKDNLRLVPDKMTSAIARLEMCLVMNSISGVRGFCST